MGNALLVGLTPANSLSLPFWDSQCDQPISLVIPNDGLDTSSLALLMDSCSKGFSVRLPSYLLFYPALPLGLLHLEVGVMLSPLHLWGGTYTLKVVKLSRFISAHTKG
ncbi:hypothetical protein MicvaDRAFT_0021 [Microcoleus vaginatus FGP-2]|nr:hypothetical protein MicvaDRAFT_0021 [Microcoleus vaginatus FGP-2]